LQTLENKAIDYLKSQVSPDVKTLYALRDKALANLPSVNTGGFYSEDTRDSLAEKDIGYWILTNDKLYSLFGRQTCGFKTSIDFKIQADYKDRRNFHNALMTCAINYVANEKFKTLSELLDYDTFEKLDNQITKIFGSIGIDIDDYIDYKMEKLKEQRWLKKYF